MKWNEESLVSRLADMLRRITDAYSDTLDLEYGSASVRASVEIREARELIDEAARDNAEAVIRQSERDAIVQWLGENDPPDGVEGGEIIEWIIRSIENGNCKCP